MNLKVSPYHFEEIVRRGYSLDIVYMLKLIHQEYDVQEMCSDSVKMTTLCQTLERKGLVSHGRLTLDGKELLAFIDSKEEKKFSKKKISVTEFEEWWKVYPGTDNFTYNGKTFTGARTLRQNKEECRIRFDKILLEGEHTAKDLIDALKFDVHQKKEASYKTGANKLTYMQNSLTYLNQRSYEPFIELIKEGAKMETSARIVGGTDI